MKQTEVADDTYERLAFADVITRLVEAPPEPKARPASADEKVDPVGVHVVYQGTRINGVFDPATNQLHITSGPLAGRAYPSSSAAAIAVVESVNPGRAYPQTNGRTFWIVDSTGKTLRSLIGRRSAKY